MILDVQQIPVGGLTRSETVVLSDARTPPTEGPIAVRLRAIRQRGQEVYVAGLASAALRMECDRCLQPFSLPVSVALDAHFLPQAALTDAERCRMEAEEADLCFYTGTVIRLEEMIASRLLLSTPMHPLCHEQCAGLCPRCGSDLNVAACACPPEGDRSRSLVFSKELHAKSKT